MAYTFVEVCYSGLIRACVDYMSNIVLHSGKHIIKKPALRITIFFCNNTNVSDIILHLTFETNKPATY